MGCCNSNSKKPNNNEHGNNDEHDNAEEGGAGKTKTIWIWVTGVILIVGLLVMFI